MPTYTLEDQMHSGKKLDLTVEVTGVVPTDKDLKAMVALLYFGEKAKLHQTAKAKNVPANSKGYLHVEDSRLLAVLSYTEAKVAAGKITQAAKIQVSDKIGKVKSGVHTW